jgi:hypothetical protein
MSLAVHYWGALPGYDPSAAPFREEDVVVHCMVRAVKGQLAAKAAALVSAVDGQTHRIAGGTERIAFDIFGQWGARLLGPWWRNALLIPVPSSHHIVSGVPFTASRLAQSIADHLPEEVNIRAASILTFSRPMRHDSSRGTSAIQEALQCELATLKGCNVVLVDDICVTGAHLTACARFLRSRGAEAGLALCLARFVRSRHPTPLRVAPEDIEDVQMVAP